MSKSSLHRVICPKCNKEQVIERYDSINDYHYELFPKIIDKSIFDYECKNCKETIHEPYPLLFHKMGFPDIQIGYRMAPLPTSILAAMFPAVASGIHALPGNEIREYYENEDDFASRVQHFTKCYRFK